MEISKKSKLKKIYNVVATVLLTVVFAFLLFVVILSSVQRKQGEDVKILGHYMFTVVSDSMEPTIMVGDVIWCKAAKIEDVKVGAIITFSAPSGPLAGHNETHKIVNILTDDNGEEYLVTQGDNCDEIDPWGKATAQKKLRKSDVKAVYTRTLKGVTGLMRFISKQPFVAYIVLVAVPMLLVCALFIVGYVRDHVKKKTQEKTDVDSLTDEEKERIAKEYLQAEKEIASESDLALSPDVEQESVPVDDEPRE